VADYEPATLVMPATSIGKLCAAHGISVAKWAATIFYRLLATRIVCASTCRGDHEESTVMTDQNLQHPRVERAAA
jgi:hypothetical protein